MELETIDQINLNYNKFFYATMCHVCKRFGDDVPLLICGDCEMISYCGREHQKQHWAQHKTLCKIIRNMLRNERMQTHNVTWQERTKMKQDLMETISSKLKRPLEFYEKQMFNFPQECMICYEQKLNSLVDCRNCAVSLCKDHENDIKHKDICASLELYLRISLTALTFSEGISVDLHYLQHVSNSKTFQDMKDFMNIYGDIKPCSKISDDILVAEHSDCLTRPLTLFHAMQVLNYVPNRQELVIHVLAANFFEEITVRAWELLLHLIQTKSLVIIMIGTELKSESHSLSICDDCLSRGKEVSLLFHKVLYKSYVRSSWFIKPDLIVGFNDTAEHEFKSDPEMWEPFMQMLAKQNCPFVLTSFFQTEIEKYIDSINIFLDRKVDYYDKNPFASLKPFRSIGPEQVFFQNDFMVIYRSLC